jgi:hypothetical protein
MAKREFIEKEKVKKSLDEGWYRGVYPRNDIICLHTFTEQDIVKPYLEKIRKDMMYDIYMEGVNMSGEYQGCWVRFKEIEKIVDKYFDNLLSEQGDTDSE